MKGTITECLNIFRAPHKDQKYRFVNWIFNKFIKSIQDSDGKRFFIQKKFVSLYIFRQVFGEVIDFSDIVFTSGG